MDSIYQINSKPYTEGERGLPKVLVPFAQVLYHGILGDFNRYREEKHNGRLDRALLLMPLEMIAVLNEEGWPIQPGDIGENITTKGIVYSDYFTGARYRLGEIEIEISELATPCENLKLLPYIGQERWPECRKAMMGRRGWYARVLKEGVIHQNDEIKRI